MQRSGSEKLLLCTFASGLIDEDGGFSDFDARDVVGIDHQLRPRCCAGARLRFE